MDAYLTAWPISEGNHRVNARELFITKTSFDQMRQSKPHLTANLQTKARLTNDI